MEFDGLRLYLGEPITAIQNEHVQIIYEGTIFDATPDELLGSQHVLDTAFGLYTYVRIHRGERTVTLGTDRQGYSPLYFAQEDGRLLFSSSLTLLKYELRRVDPDYEAWDEILNLEDLLGSKTTIKQIKRLSPGMRLLLADGRITCETYWQPELPQPGRKEDYARRNNELLMEALELTRSTPGDKIMLMSGGLDSRRLGVTANHIDLPITVACQESVSWSNRDEEVLLARRVADLLDRPFISAPLLPSAGFYNDYLVRDFWLGFESNQHEWILPLVRMLPENSVLYDGITGDVTIQCGWFLEVYPELVDKWRDKDIDHAARRICSGEKIFDIDKNKLESSLFERVRENIRSMPECPHRLNYYWLTNRARRNTALQAQLYSLHGHRVCFPFLYYPLFMQCMSLDPEALLKKRYQLECMTALNPAAADLPTTREKVGPEFVIDRSQEQYERLLLFSKRTYLRNDVINCFPSIAWRLHVFRLARLLGIGPIRNRLKWLAWPAARMSTYMDYLEDTAKPAFPVEEAEPALLKERLIQYD